VPLGIPLAALERTLGGNTRRTGFDPERSSYLSPMTATAVISNIIPVIAKLRRSRGHVFDDRPDFSRAHVCAVSIP
jgi:hypothetical protein